MKPRPILLAVVASLLFSSFGFSEMLRVTIRKAPIRSEPTSNSKLVTTAMEGTLLELVDRDGAWFIVSVPQSGKVGYVHSALVELVLEETPYTAPTQPAPAPRSPEPQQQVTAPPPPTAPPPRRVYAEPAPAPSNTQPPPPQRIDPRSQAYGNPCFDDAGYGTSTVCSDLQFEIDKAEEKKRSGKKLVLVGLGLNVAAVALVSVDSGHAGAYWWAALGGGALGAYGAIKWVGGASDLNDLDREGRMKRCWAVLPTRDGVRAAMTWSW